MRLHTRLPIEECNARLAASVDAEFSWRGLVGSKPILGGLHDTSFRLRVRRRNYRNDLAPYFYGRFVASPSGTLLEGEFRMDPIMIGILVVWFGGCALFSLIGLSLMASRNDPRLGLFVLIPIVMMALGAAGVKYAQSLGRDEEKPIVGFLKSTLEAEEGGESPEGSMGSWHP